MKGTFNLKKAEEDIKSVFAKHGIYLRGSVEFKNSKKPPFIARIAMWVIKRCGGEVALRIVRR